MPLPIIQSIQIGMPRQLGTPGSEDPNRKPWFSGFMKNQVPGPVEVTLTGIKGDGQADLKNHGGPDKAILCYSADHFPFWSNALSRDDVTGGMFGENLTISHLSEDIVCIGDTFAIGGVVVQITQPRQPCWKLGRRWNEPLLPKMVVKNGFSGWYLRVLTPGIIEAGQGFERIEQPNPDWTVRRSHETMYRKDSPIAERKELASLPELSDAWQRELTAKLHS
ncbi:MOSC domain-containing protein [Mariniblastus sp.]|nr:MOSC domain-containing protein [Mariniblastus sp.]